MWSSITNDPTQNKDAPFSIDLWLRHKHCCFQHRIEKRVIKSIVNKNHQCNCSWTAPAPVLSEKVKCKLVRLNGVEWVKWWTSVCVLCSTTYTRSMTHGLWTLNGEHEHTIQHDAWAIINNSWIGQSIVNLLHECMIWIVTFLPFFVPISYSIVPLDRNETKKTSRKNAETFRQVDCLVGLCLVRIMQGEWRRKK